MTPKIIPTGFLGLYGLDPWRGQRNCPSGDRLWSVDLAQRTGLVREIACARACTPALCSPLNGVIAPGQPTAAASFGELNHRPRWYICTGLKAGFWAASGKGGLLNTWGAGATFGATAK